MFVICIPLVGMKVCRLLPIIGVDALVRARQKFPESSIFRLASIEPQIQYCCDLPIIILLHKQSDCPIQLQYHRLHTMVDFETVLIAVTAAGTGLPAIALVFGAPGITLQGLASGSYNTWTATEHGKFGLYMYTVSDIVLGAFCALSLVGGEKKSSSMPIVPSTVAALTAIAVHQYSYLAASISAFGFKRDHVPSIVWGAVAGVLAWRKQ